MKQQQVHTVSDWFLNDKPAGRYDHAIDEIRKQRDRGAAIIATSILEEHLLDAIQARLNRHDATEKKVFNGYGPLATFSARIDLGLLLGLYPEEGHTKLHLIRRIRNNFAHSMHPISFKSQRGDCNKLRKARGSYREMNKWVDATLNKVQAIPIRLGMYRSSTNPRTQFIRAIQEMCFHLTVQTLVGNSWRDWTKENNCSAQPATKSAD
ncbi:hypothetical protein [Bradyrhizobium sp. CCGUVB14]|uniref:hypothetical protein n=1 Tax=Bradyrhizobium sp. CCGUVB14 TaxID=2949628 RepID=UPI0020B227D5|nr:hypothetical protein [Bradyrhizobium sp. CCGUVB14]MCP3444201.1 hypothetical protein [Bradyrhizobium sp. CCGUVB14]